jgi:hypothetical protein
LLEAQKSIRPVAHDTFRLFLNILAGHIRSPAFRAEKEFGAVEGGTLTPGRLAGRVEKP